MMYLVSLLFQLASIALILPLIAGSLAYLFYYSKTPLPFGSGGSMAAMESFEQRRANQIDNGARFDAVVAKASDEAPVFVLYGSPRCPRFSNAHRLFHQLHNVFVIFDDDAELVGSSGPVLFKFGTGAEILATATE